MTEPIQILYECEKCGDLDAAPTRIAGATVSTRLCPLCETEWGKYIRSQNVWKYYLLADWRFRTAQSMFDAERTNWDVERHRDELCGLAESWLER